MSIRNEMERLVREEVARLRESGGAGACWCPLCETDVIALALTILPPLYCREEDRGRISSLVKPGKVGDAVQTALRRVQLRPKHRAGVWPASRDYIDLVNFAYEVGTGMVGPALGQSAARCSCEACRSDALAYALNRYPAKYGVTRAGRRSLHPTYLDFMRHELGLLIAQAARIVAVRPNHAT